MRLIAPVQEPELCVGVFIRLWAPAFLIGCFLASVSLPVRVDLVTCRTAGDNSLQLLIAVLNLGNVHSPNVL